jgi:hypothetical protein
MNTTSHSIVFMVFASTAIAAAPEAQRLTPQRIAALTAPSDASKPSRYKVEISDLAILENRDRPKSATPRRAPLSITFPADKPEAVLEAIREFRFPAKFSPPQAAADGSALTAPPMPAAFKTVNTGWTIRLSAKQHGNLVAIAGAADYVSAEFVPGDYGPLSGPIYSEDGKFLSPNKYHQPKIQTTTTHFHLFAVPGQPCEVTLHRGTKSQKHKITVTTE